MNPPASKPLLLGWNTCDMVHIDPATGKYYLLGVFSGIRAKQFPAVHPRMFWFLALTDVAAGAHQLRITLGFPTEAPQVVVERPFEAQNPAQRIHLINEIKNLRFERPDHYGIVIEVDEEPLLATNLTVA